MDTSNSSRIAPAESALDLNLLGEFAGAVAETKDFPERSGCTIRLFVDRLEIPELGFSLRYEEMRDVLGGSAGEMEQTLSKSIPEDDEVILVRFAREDGKTKDLALSWRGEGTGSIEYCEIMLYRAFAAHKVRSKNNGAPCHGIVGY